MSAVTELQDWDGRIDTAEGDSGRRWHQIVQPLHGQAEGIGLIGFVCDAGVARNHGRIGARKGPSALRAMLANLPVNRCIRIVDAGDIVCIRDDELESAQDDLASALARMLALGLFPITLGGGHEVAFASWSGLAKYFEAADSGRERAAPRIGVVNIDAHLDLRMAERPSSGTPFRQIAEQSEERRWPFRYCCLGASEFANTQALFERARGLGVTIVRDEDMTLIGLEKTLAVLDAFLADVDHVYLTLDLDGLPASIAPGVSAPAARGVDLAVVEAVVDHVVASGKLRLADIAELNPGLDIDNRTARTGARLVGRIAEGITVLEARLREVAGHGR